MSRTSIIKAIEKAEEDLKYIIDNAEDTPLYTVMDWCEELYDNLDSIKDNFEEYSDEVEDIQDDFEGLVSRLEALK